MESNLAVAIVGVACTMFSALLMAFIVFKRKERPYSLAIFLCALCIFVWHLFNTLFYVWPDPDIAIKLHEFKYLGTCFLPVTFLFTAYCITGHQKYFTARNFIALSIVPALGFLLAITNDYHYLFRAAYEFTEGPVRILTSQNGILFYLILIYGYTLSIYTVFYTITAYRRAPLSYHNKFGQIVIAAIIPVAVSLLAVIKAFVANYEITLFANLIAFAILICAEYFTDNSFYFFTHERVFDGLHEPSFVLNEAGEIVDGNRSAFELIPKAANKAAPIAFDLLLDEWISSCGYCIESDEKGEYIAAGNRALTISRSPIYASKDRVVGAFVELKDSTSERMLIKLLHEQARLDPLTGLNNRLSYEGELSRLRTLTGLEPFGIISADINGLKRVNDTKGHGEGDRLIIRVARLLRQTLPEGAFIARIGGDEFVAFVMDTDMTALKEYASAFKAQAAPDVSMSLGLAVCYDVKLLDEEVVLADNSMYDSKRRYYLEHDRRGVRV